MKFFNRFTLNENIYKNREDIITYVSFNVLVFLFELFIFLFSFHLNPSLTIKKEFAFTHKINKKKISVIAICKFQS